MTHIKLLLLALTVFGAFACDSTRGSIDGAAGGNTGGTLGETGGNGPNTGGGGSGGSSSTSGSTGSRVLGDHQCRGNADCNVQQHETCVPPGGATPCGVCLWITSPCTLDSDCQGDGASSICEFAAGCVCPAGSKICTAGCSDASDCGTGEACTGRHCVPASCQMDTDCPMDFGCSSGICGRKTCTTDADCSGYCVTGGCYTTPGTCYGAVA